MAMSKLLHNALILSAVMLSLAANRMSAQELSMFNSFSNRTFNGTVDVSWPVTFDSCVFVTDSVVLNRSLGAVFRNCRIESKSGALYMALEGDGIILYNCEILGCDELKFSVRNSLSDRNYVSGVVIDGHEYEVDDEEQTIIDIDGLELAESVNGKRNGPLLMQMKADRSVLMAGDSANLRVLGLEEGMFLGWQCPVPYVDIRVGEDCFCCEVTAPREITIKETVVISAYTEYGLEAACALTLMPHEEDVEPVRHGWLWRLFHRRKR